ncbi:MAG: multicopper oxidase family protein [Candidatus Rokubacteria bacterium]|nr:multicopper oxidase family protein [Candidatus Rokubacteria bacterium]
MTRLTRRGILGGVGALGVVGMARLAPAGEGHGDARAAARAAAEIERAAADFSNPLRLPGASGLYGVLRATEVREIRVRRTDLAVLPGLASPFWAYAVESGGKRFLNPTLVARRGDEVRVRMANELDQPTIIHWHGLANDDRNDGTGIYVAAPGNAYDYGFTVRDRASMYWYHPHPLHITAPQTYRGLAGLFFVADDDEEALRRALGLEFGVTEIPLVLQDKSFDHEGRLEYGVPREAMFHGFIGEEILVNLTARPAFSAARRIYRFRLLNGSNARNYRLAFLQGGRRLGFYLVGTDGGLLDAPKRVDQAFLTPAQRLDVLLDLREAREGRPVVLATLGFDPMHNEGAMETGTPKAAAASGGGHEGHAGGAMDGEEKPILRIDVEPTSGYAKKIPATLSRLPAPPPAGGKPRRIVLAHDGKGHWTINGWQFEMNATPLTVRRGARETWLIENSRASMPHPMHIHGFQFRVLERRGTPAQVRVLGTDSNGLLPQDRGLLDTVLAWPGESVRIALDFTHPFPGDQTYMFHCHNLEHEDLGMMIQYGVKA